MTTERHPNGIVERMHAEIDGRNTPAQTRELEEYLVSHPDAQREFSGLRALARRLAAVPPVEPPSHLFHRIISAIPFGRHARENAHAPAGGGLSAWLGRLLPRPRLRYVTTFAVGVVGGFVLLWATLANRAVDGQFDISTLYGTMRVIEPADGFEVVGSVGLELDQVHGEIRLHESDRKLMAEVSLHPATEIEWTLHYDQSEVAFEGYRQVDGTSGTVVAASDRMKVSQAGDGRFILFFTEKGSAAPMSIDIFESGNLIYHNELVGGARE